MVELEAGIEVRINDDGTASGMARHYTGQIATVLSDDGRCITVQALNGHRFLCSKGLGKHPCEFTVCSQKRSIIGYKAPYSLFNDAILAGTIYMPLASKNNITYAATIEGSALDSGKTNLPKEIVETWEPVYGYTEFPVGTWVTCIAKDDELKGNWIHEIKHRTFKILEPKSKGWSGGKELYKVGIDSHTHKGGHGTGGLKHEWLRVATDEEIHHAKSTIFVIGTKTDVVYVRKDGIQYKDRVLDIGGLKNIPTRFDDSISYGKIGDYSIVLMEPSFRIGCNTEDHVFKLSEIRKIVAAYNGLHK